MTRKDYLIYYLPAGATATGATGAGAGAAATGATGAGAGAAATGATGAGAGAAATGATGAGATGCPAPLASTPSPSEKASLRYFSFRSDLEPFSALIRRGGASDRSSTRAGCSSPPGRLPDMSDTAPGIGEDEVASALSAAGSGDDSAFCCCCFFLAERLDFLPRPLTSFIFRGGDAAADDASPLALAPPSPKDVPFCCCCW